MVFHLKQGSSVVAVEKVQPLLPVCDEPFHCGGSGNEPNVISDGLNNVTTLTESSVVLIFYLKQLFYQLKGDMCLKVIENNKHKDVHIREGEVS